MIHFYSHSITRHQHFNASIVQETSNISKNSRRNSRRTKGKKIRGIPINHTCIPQPLQMELSQADKDNSRHSYFGLAPLWRMDKFMSRIANLMSCWTSRMSGLDVDDILDSIIWDIAWRSILRSLGSIVLIFLSPVRIWMMALIYTLPVYQVWIYPLWYGCD